MLSHALYHRIKTVQGARIDLASRLKQGEMLPHRSKKALDHQAWNHFAIFNNHFS